MIPFTTRLRASVAACTIMLIAGWSPARAQEPMFSGAATQPSPEHFTLRTQVEYTRLRGDPTPARREVEDVRTITTLTYGLARDLAFSLTAPVAYQRIDALGTGASDHRFGVGDATLLVRWRAWREDTGPIDTFRVALLGGVGLPTPGEIAGDGFNPIVGAVATWIRGRHGFNVGAQYTVTTGAKHDPLFPGETLADYLRCDGSYLFRLAPEQYGAGSEAAVYASVEVNGRYETSGEGQILISPGILYEAQTFALEFAVQLPAWQDVSRRPESRFSVLFGVRFLF